jgi:gliding motility-associated-like protein
MKKSFVYSVMLILSVLSMAPRAGAQTTMNICTVRSLILTIYTVQGKAVAWQWSLPGATYAGPLTDSVVSGVKYNTAGNYKATCKVTFSTGKDSTNVFNINAFDGTVQNIPLKDTVICGNVNLTLDAGNATQSLAKYKWTPGAQTTRTINVNTAGVYGVSVYTTDQYSYLPGCAGCKACDSAFKQATITKGAAATVDLGPDRFICNDNPITLDAGPNMVSYLWQPNGETSQTIVIGVGGTYSVTVKNSDNCVGTDMVTFKDSCPMLIFVPNAITPDENGVNDVFKWVGNMKMKVFHLKIYNRWGEKVFDTNDPAAAWDGKYNKDYVIPGVYAYLLDCVDTNEVRHVMKGNISVLK